jgi:hypothetical protein
VRILWADPENYVYPGDNRHEKISEWNEFTETDRRLP